MAKSDAHQGNPNDPHANQADAPERSRTMLIRVDERQMRTSYSNAFRTHTTAEEVMIDFGLNLIAPRSEAPGTPSGAGGASGGATSGGGGGGETENQILFQVNDRIILNYFTIKRLALTLGQIVRMHEDQFGELKLDATERLRKR